jgi:MSHA pilin protein MshD
MRHSIVHSWHKCQQGFTLIELIISMVIISIALGGVLLAINFTVSHSADPLIQHQAIAIAEAYMEEILLQEYYDPDDDPAVVEDSRDLYDNVDDYNELIDVGAHNQMGTAISDLENYTVSVIVADVTLNTVPAKKITVTVNHSVMGDMELVGYRTNY